MKIAAVHFDSVLADVDKNMENAHKKIIEAVNEGAELVLFPEFFTTGFAFTNELLDSVLKYENPQIKLTKWAKELNVIIGGSYLNFDGKDVLNTFSLTFPTGEVYKHSKDIPTVLEHFCYTYGDENSVFDTPIGRIGVAICWEQIRYATVKRMINKVDLVLAASCWWRFSKEDGEELNKYNDFNSDMAINAPITLAKIFNVPVIHASHNASFTGYTFPKALKKSTRTIMGATEIIDENGKVLIQKLYNEKPGILIADIDYEKDSKTTKTINTDKYWIPDMPPYIQGMWDKMNPLCEKYYNLVSKPYLTSKAK